MLKTFIVNTIGFSKEFCTSLKYQLSYLGADVFKIEELDNCIRVCYCDKSENIPNKIRGIIDDLDKRLNEVIPEVIFSHNGENMDFDGIIEELSATGEIIIYDKGLVGFGGRFLELYQKLDTMFRTWGTEIGGEEYLYPDLISLDTLVQYDYLRQFPQHLMFSSHLKEDLNVIKRFSSEIKRSMSAVSPDYIDVEGTKYANKLAVCPHVYKQYEGRTIDKPIIITTIGKCKRYESINFNYFERLLDFSLREIVVIGSPEYVLDFRNRMIEKTKSFIERADLCANIKSAADPFFSTEFSSKLLLQQKFKLKYELNLDLSSGKESAVGSFNYHGSHFVDYFNIKSNSGAPLVTGCVGFGIERFVYAIMKQKGLNASI